MTNAARLALIAATVAIAACSNNTQSTTAPSSATPSTTTELFSGTLAVQGSTFYSFNVTQAGTVSVMLASLTGGAPGPVLDSMVRLGIGVPAGFGCDATTSVETSAALTAQISDQFPAGIHCVNVADAGHLRTSANFAVRIIHP